MLKITAKKSPFTNKKGRIKFATTLKSTKIQQMQSKKSLRMPFCLYGASMLFATL
ncbi:hypothetical protein BTM275_14770 [Helicobacter pylori]